MVINIKVFLEKINQNQLEFFYEQVLHWEYGRGMDTITAEYLAMDNTIKHYGINLTE